MEPSQAPRQPTSRLAHWLYGLFVISTVLALVWPGPWWIAQVATEPIGGLPPIFAWNASWIVLAFFALLTYHRSQSGGEDE